MNNRDFRGPTSQDSTDFASLASTFSNNNLILVCADTVTRESGSHTHIPYLPTVRTGGAVAASSLNISNVLRVQVGLRIRGLRLNFGREFARIRELGEFGQFRPNLALLFVT